MSGPTTPPGFVLERLIESSRRPDGTIDYDLVAWQFRRGGGRSTDPAVAGERKTYVDDKLERLEGDRDLTQQAIVRHGQRLDALEREVAALRERQNARAAVRPNPDRGHVGPG